MASMTAKEMKEMMEYLHEGFEEDCRYRLPLDADGDGVLDACAPS